jgi:hypothetical protein
MKRELFVDAAYFANPFQVNIDGSISGYGKYFVSNPVLSVFFNDTDGNVQQADT